MARYFPYLRAFLVFLFGVLVAGPLGNQFYDWGLPFVAWPAVVLIFVIVGGLTGYAYRSSQRAREVEQRQHEIKETLEHEARLRNEFALYRRVEDLRPA